jgi:GTP pyrophosphokinase
MMQMESNRIVEVTWPVQSEAQFVAGVRVAGDDRTGLLNDLTHAISSYNNTNIRSVNIDSQDGYFKGTFIVFVRDIDHLNTLLEKIRRVRGIKKAERFEE